MIPKVLVLRAAGTNCDCETKYAFEKVGASADLIHINRILERKDILNQFHVLAIPGGFTYGDDVAAGRILANQLRYNLKDEITRFIEDGKLIIGICNGFQVLVKTGLLPGFGRGLESLRERDCDDQSSAHHGGARTPTGFGEQITTLTFNDSNKFEDRWVYLKSCSGKSVYIDEGAMLYMPVAHGEGKFVTQDAEVLNRLKANGHVIFKYVNERGEPDGYPWNPNGSVEDIAGICDPTGRILGMMPHPERHIEPTHHPRWTREGLKEEGDGVMIFRNAVEYVRENL